MYSRLVVEPERCVGCRICEYVCSLKNYGECNPVRARIHVVRSDTDGVIVTIPVVCQQCSDALCLAMCPAGALSRSPETGVVVVATEKCLGCRNCVEVCPFGASSVDPRTGTSEKCDLCGGDPICVKYCPEEAIKFVAAEEESITRRRDSVGPYLKYLQSSVEPAVDT